MPKTEVEQAKYDLRETLIDCLHTLDSDGYDKDIAKMLDEHGEFMLVQKVSRDFAHHYRAFSA